MLCTETLFEELTRSDNLVERNFTDLTDSLDQDLAFVIKQGELLLTDNRILDTGLSATHKIGQGEPVWFVETMSKRPKELQFKNIGETTLFQVEGRKIRHQVDQAGFLSKEILRYSLARVYERTENRRNFSFEDQLYLAKDEIDRVYYKQGDIVFDWGDTSDAIYFIIDGKVSVRTIRDNSFAVLGSTDSFGEYSLITNKARTLRATAETDCQLFRMNADWVLGHLSKEHPLVRLTLHQTLSMLSIRNQMRLIKSNDGVYEDRSETV